MKQKDALAIVEELLRLYASKNFDTQQKVASYQRGYLTGILASIIREDFYARQIILNKINERGKK